MIALSTVFSFISTYKKPILIFLIVSILIGTFVLLNRNLEEKRKQIETLKQVLKSQQIVIEQTQENQSKVTEIRKGIYQGNKKDMQRRDTLEKTFEGDRFSRLAYEKPLLIEKRINKGSEKRIQCYDTVKDTWNDCSL